MAWVSTGGPAVTRHIQALGEEQASEVVEAVAELVVKFLKVQCNPGQPASCGLERAHERSDAQQPDAR